MAAVRPLPQQSIIECIPPASEIADLRILNKDLNFIQASGLDKVQIFIKYP